MLAGTDSKNKVYNAKANCSSARVTEAIVAGRISVLFHFDTFGQLLVDTATVLDRPNTRHYM
jgi:hypothetical protein